MKIVPVIASAGVALLIAVTGASSALAVPTSDPSTVTSSTIAPTTTAQPTTTAPEPTTTQAPTTTAQPTTTLGPTTSVDEIPQPAPSQPATTIPGSGNPNPDDSLPETGSRTTTAWFALGFVVLGVGAIALSRRRFGLR